MGNSGESGHHKGLLSGEKRWDWVDSCPRKGREFFPIEPHQIIARTLDPGWDCRILYLASGRAFSHKAYNQVPMFRSCPGPSDLNLLDCERPSSPSGNRCAARLRKHSSHVWAECTCEGEPGNLPIPSSKEVGTSYTHKHECEYNLNFTKT